MRLLSVDGSEGKAEIDGVARRVSLDLVPEAKVGDFVIIHAGYAIQMMDEKAAEEQLALLAEALGPDQ
jgi:hydrogenase expression/formation protein HypC